MARAPAGRYTGAMEAVVIGGGISGLAAAYRLHRAGVAVTLLESSGRAGGVIQTLRAEGCLLEAGPDAWASNKPAALELARELGLEEQVIGVRPDARRSFILRDGVLRRLPEGFFLLAPMSLRALAATDVLSAGAKLRMALEPFIWPRVDGADESLASFVRRRFGREALERVAQPMVAGIYSADPEKLSLAATFPQFLEWERKEGSVINALRKRGKSGRGARVPPAGSTARAGWKPAQQSRPEAYPTDASGPRYGLFLTFRDGMETLPRALLDALPQEAVRLNTSARGLARDGDRWRVDTPGGPLRADAVILALPAYASAALIAGVGAELSAALAEIEYSGSAVVNFVFERAQITHPMDGIGAVIPAVEGRKLLAFSFSHVKFEGRAPQGTAVVRAFLGGAMQPEVAALPPDELRALALSELRELIGIRGGPHFSHVATHPRSMAQYHVGHVGRVARIRELAARHRGLHVIGNALDGVGIPDCIRRANSAAAQVMEAR
jgi:protoporphyrinogen/coproporphyrinogen III oxidase